MDLKELRLEKSWSQEQLADISGVSVRTVQRLEKGEKPGMETLKALAAAFEVSSSQLQEKLNGNPEQDTMSEQSSNRKSITDYGWKGLFIHLGVFMAVITWLLILAESFDKNDEFVGAIGIAWGGMIGVHIATLLGSAGKG